MKIAVIGASGKSGKIFVAAALEAGHTVVAGVHSKPLDLQHDRLTTRQCDTNSRQDLDDLISRCDTVVSLIGHGRHSAADLQTVAITNVIAAMNEHGRKRIISLTGTGVRYPGDHIILADRIVNVILGLIDPSRIRDGQRHAALLEKSDLDWTILRVLKLRDTSPKAYKLRPQGPTKLITSRNEVARAILEVLEKKSFIQEAPIIAKP